MEMVSSFPSCWMRQIVGLMQNALMFGLAAITLVDRFTQYCSNGEYVSILTRNVNFLCHEYGL